MPWTKAEAQLPTPMIATRTLSCWRAGPPLVWAACPFVVLTWCVPSFSPCAEFKQNGTRRSRPRYTRQLAVDVQDALQDGERAQYGEHVDGWREQVEVAERGAAREDQADREDHHAHRAGRDPDLALDAERLRPRARVGDHQRREHRDDDRGHGDWLCWRAKLPPRPSARCPPRGGRASSQKRAERRPLA